MSAAHPWMKFYPRDWRGDQMLRTVSLGARGFWIECLALMHEAKPYGHLLVNGKPVDDLMLSRLVGASVEEVVQHRKELLDAGVASLSKVGVLQSRRMIRDESRAKKGRKGAERRWSQTTENTEENGRPNGLPITQKPEARLQTTRISKEEPPSTPQPAKRYDPAEGLPDDVRKVMDAGGFVTPPPDLGKLGQWYRAGATLEQDILPVIAAVSKSVMDRTGRVPIKLQLFDQPIHEKLAKDEREIRRLRASRLRDQQMQERLETEH